MAEEITASGSIDKRLPYPGFNAFRPFVTNELNRRKTTYPIYTVSPFVRMTSTTEDKEYGRKFFTLGLHGFHDTDFDMFDVSYGAKSDVVGYSYDVNTSDGTLKKRLHSTDMISAENLPPDFVEGLNERHQSAVQEQRAAFETFQREQAKIFAANSHPVPGITHVSIDRKGPFAPFIATVKWQCYNRAQLEFLRHHFMNVGQYVVLEWGNQFANKQIAKTLDFSDPEIVTELATCIRKGRSYIIKNWVEPNDGNYDFVVGNVSNFNVTVDHKTGIYNCSTTIVSVGEVIFGINNHFTFIDTDGVFNDSAQPMSSVEDFFKPNRKYDELINSLSSDPTLVANYTTKWDGNTTNLNTSETELANNVSSNPQDYRFISWKFFTENLIPEIFALIRGDQVTNDLNQWFDIKYDDVNEPPERQLWVGYNEHLKSTNPDVMILVTKDMKTPAQGFDGIGKFGELDSHRGKLSKGVWLNVGMIRRAFLQTNNLVQAIRNILSSLNNATENFWKLTLIWDEEIHKWRIVDSNFGDTQRVPKFYVFNEIQEDESAAFDILKVDLDSAFPAELITQTMLYSKYKASSPEERRRLIKQYPKIGTTSTFIFSLNWTSLIDVLAQELEKENTRGADTTIKGSIPNIEPNTNRARIGSGLFLGSSGLVTSTAGGNGQPGKAVGENVVSHKSNVTNSPPSQFAVGSHVIPPRDVSIDQTTGLPTDVKVLGSNSNAFSTTSTRLLHPQFKNSFNVWKSIVEGYPGYDIKVYIESATRNPEYQKILKSRYGDNAAPPGKSKHQTGQAVDFRVTLNGVPIRMNDENNYWIWNIMKDAADHVNKTSVVTDPDKFARLQMLEAIGERHHIQMEGKILDVIGDDAFKTGATYEEHYKGDVPNPKSLRYIFRSNKSDNEYEEGLIPDEEKEVIDKQLGISQRFGDTIISMVELDPSGMVARITKNGYDNYPKPNGYVAGFPTTTSVTIEILGLSGISISDIFGVDRLPYVFEQYGAFQVTEMTDTITEKGWITKIRGYFKLLWLEGKDA